MAWANESCSCAAPSAVRLREHLQQWVPEFAQKLDLHDYRIRAISRLSEKATRERLVPALPGASADGATAPETLRHQDRVVGRSGERRLMASTEGDIRTACAG